MRQQSETPGCVAFHPDCAMVCVLPAGHDGDHSIGRPSRKGYRQTWPQGPDDGVPARELRRRAALDALDEALFRCVDEGFTAAEVVAHIAGHEIAEVEK